MFVLIIYNTYIQFTLKKLIQKTYIIKKAVLTIQLVKLIDENKFAKVAFNKNLEVFVSHISSLIEQMMIKKVIIFAEYLGFIDIFLKVLVEVLPKPSKVNQHLKKIKK